MTVREHITRELENLENSPIGTFKTSDIQELSYEGKQEFGKYLGSPGTYERTFRELRKSGLISVIQYKYRTAGQRQWSWYLQNIGEYNEES